MYSGDVASGSIEAGDKPDLHRIAAGYEHDRNRRGCRLCRLCGRVAAGGDDDGHWAARELDRICRQPVIVALGPAKFERYILTFSISRFFQSLTECSDKIIGLAGASAADPSYHRQCRLLGACRERPRRRAPKQRDEIAPSHHSMTSSARASSACDKSRPSALATLRLTMS